MKVPITMELIQNTDPQLFLREMKSVDYSKIDSVTLALLEVHPDLKMTNLWMFNNHGEALTIAPRYEAETDEHSYVVSTKFFMSGTIYISIQVRKNDRLLYSIEQSFEGIEGALIFLIKVAVKLREL